MIELRHVTKSWPGREGRMVAVDDINLLIPQGAFFTLLGPSGCGKTTTLRIIAGLEVPDTGTVIISSEVVYSSAERILRPPHRRQIGMVFQSYAIWPHLTVEQNVAFPLRRLGLSRAEVEARTQAILHKVGMADLARKPATKLSGGEQQRVALARALVGNPRVLLLDEPLSNLDAKLREEMRQELRALHREVGITTLYVTHDQHEALALADLVGIMHEGRLVEVGTPNAIYYHPQTKFTAQFVGKLNAVPPRDGREPRAYFRPEDGVLMSTEGEVDPATHVVLSGGRVVYVAFLGERNEVRVQFPGGDITLFVPGRTRPAEGVVVHVAVPRDRLIEFAVDEDTPPGQASPISRVHASAEVP